MVVPQVLSEVLEALSGLLCAVKRPFSIYKGYIGLITKTITRLGVLGEVLKEPLGQCSIVYTPYRKGCGSNSIYLYIHRVLIAHIEIYKSQTLVPRFVFTVDKYLLILTQEHYMTYYVVNGVVYFNHKEALAAKER